MDPPPRPPPAHRLSRSRLPVPGGGGGVGGGTGPPASVVSRLPSPATVRPSPSRDSPRASALAEPTRARLTLRGSASTSNLVRTTGQPARPQSHQPLGTGQGLVASVHAGLTATATAAATAAAADPRRSMRRVPPYQGIARPPSRGAKFLGATPTTCKPDVAAASPDDVDDDDDDDDERPPRPSDEILIRRPSLVLTGRRTSLVGGSVPPSCKPSFSISTAPTTDGSSPATDSPTEAAAPDLQPEPVVSAAARPDSLEDRVLKTLADVRASPARTSRYSAFFDVPTVAGAGAGSRSESRPGSSGAGAAGSRPGSSSGHSERASYSSSRSLRMSTGGHFRRPLSVIQDTVGGDTSGRPAIKARPPSTPARAAIAARSDGGGGGGVPSKIPYASASKVPATAARRKDVGGDNANKPGYATIHSTHSLKPRPSAPALRRRASANLFEKSANASKRESAQSSASSATSSALSWDGSIPSSTTTSTSSNSPVVIKSSAALREQIAKMRAAAKQGSAALDSAASDSTAPDDDVGDVVVVDDGDDDDDDHHVNVDEDVDADADADSRRSSRGIEAIEHATGPRFRDDLTPWSRLDPFNTPSQAKNNPAARVLRERIEVGRTTGRLNIAALDLKEIPPEVLKMYDLTSIGAYDGTWAESVDLTRFVAADNELERIDDTVFPDRPAEELTDDEAGGGGNMFAGLETLDLHGNLLISVPAGLRQLRQMTSLNLTHNRLSNDSIEAISQVTSLRNLKLGSNLLYGPLGSSFCKLTNLEILDLHGNTISGLPAGLAAMTRLRILDVSENSFESLPFEQLSRLPLTELKAGKNRLSGTLIRARLDLSTLQCLDVSANRLTHLAPPGVGLHLPLLHQLSVSMNRLQELPDVSGWRSLLSISADENAIEALPEGFSRLQRLRHADFSSNDIRVIPPDVARMTSLALLRITGNPLRDKKFLSISTDEIKEVLAERAEPAPGLVPASPEAPSEVEAAAAEEVASRQMDEDAQSETTDLFTTPPTSAPASPTPRSRPLSRTQTATALAWWPVGQDGILDRSSTESSTLHPVICSRVAAEHEVRQAMLHRNLFVAIPECLTFFSATLTSLSMANNRLAGDGYLAEPLELEALRELNLSGNHIESLGPLISFLVAPRLERLDVSSNRIGALPPALRQTFPDLAVLLATNNHLADLDPDAIGGMRVVDVSRNDIVHLNPRLGLLAAGGPGEGTLEKLEVRGNRFRVPRWSVLDMGTSVTLRWLRGRIPLAEMAEIPGWRDEEDECEEG